MSLPQEFNIPAIKKIARLCTARRFLVCFSLSNGFVIGRITLRILGKLVPILHLICVNDNLLPLDLPLQLLGERFGGGGPLLKHVARPRFLGRLGAFRGHTAGDELANNRDTIGKGDIPQERDALIKPQP